MKKNNLIKLLTFAIIPAILIAVWICASLLFSSEFSFSTLTYTHKKSDIVDAPQGKLFTGEKIVGEFTAKDDYLGIVILRFKSFVKYDFAGEDILIFRLREKGQKEWYHVNTFKAGILEHKLNFPLGFPVIPDSKGKEYQFEVESTMGNTKNAISLDTSLPTLSTAYQYPKSEIQASKGRTVNFVIQKLLTSFTNIDFLLSSTLFLTPLILYAAFLLYTRKYKAPQSLTAVLVVILILLDLFFLKETYLGLTISLVIGWMMVVRICKLSSRTSFIFSFIGISCWLFLIFFKIVDIQNKLNFWVYSFLVIGIAQAIIEEKSKNKDYVTMREFFKNFFKPK